MQSGNRVGASLGRTKESVKVLSRKPSAFALQWQRDVSVGSPKTLRQIHRRKSLEGTANEISQNSPGSFCCVDDELIGEISNPRFTSRHGTEPNKSVHRS